MKTITVLQNIGELRDAFIEAERDNPDLLKRKRGVHVEMTVDVYANDESKYLGLVTSAKDLVALAKVTRFKRLVLHFVSKVWKGNEVANRNAGEFIFEK